MKEIRELLADNNIISKDGIKVNGVGIMIKKLDELKKLQDTSGLKLYYLEKRLEEIRELNKELIDTIKNQNL